MPQRISIRVPATSANLGCLFDCAALALGLYLDIHVTPRQDHKLAIRYSGATPERVPTDGANLIARTIRDTLAGWGKPQDSQGLDLEIENQIPVGVGLGSSAAAIVGSLAACFALAKRPISDDELVSLATRVEGHPDNVAAAWHGGFTVTVQQGDAVRAYSCPVPDGLRLVLVVPDYPLATEQARAVLPAHYTRADAVHNVQRAAALTAQLFSGTLDLHSCLFDDRWHQPYRAALVPGLADVLKLPHPDLLGVCLSGAGPSILALVRRNDSMVGEIIRQTLAKNDVGAQILPLAPDNRGAKGWNRETRSGGPRSAGPPA